jgi:cytochrome b subunit of formate dehydrogenase/mono/diheme cytochrome c family protein
MAEQVQVQKTQYTRFAPTQRMEHIVLLVTFAGLALTGLPQKFAAEAWAKTLIQILGGIESTRIIHHFLATLLLAEAIFHGGVLSYKIFVLGYRATMIPGVRDIRDVLSWIAFNLGLRKEHPHLPRYNFGEKAEYLAVVWGTLIMALTGFMMWNPIATTNLLPGSVIPAARAAHGGEAVLAVLAILVWHVYNVHLKRFNKSMFTGKMSHEAMAEEHGAELEAIEKGEATFEVPPEILARRKRRFWPYAAVMTVVLVGVLVRFITLENTAITTVPRQNIVIFEPEVTLEAGDAAAGEAIWPTLRCARCHGDTAAGGPDAPSLRGIDLSFDEFYRQVRTGTVDKMPAFSAGEIPDPYLLHVWTWLRQLSPVANQPSEVTSEAASTAEVAATVEATVTAEAAQTAVVTPEAVSPTNAPTEPPTAAQATPTPRPTSAENE